MKEEVTVLYVTEDGQKFKSKSQAEFHEKYLAEKAVFDEWEVPELDEDVKYGDTETAFSLIADCLKTIVNKLDDGNVSDVKKVLLELSKRVEP